MPEIQQFPSPVLLHSARIAFIPGSDRDTAEVRFAVDGKSVGTDSIKLPDSLNGRVENIRAFPVQLSIGQLVQISVAESGVISTCMIESSALSEYKIIKELTEGQITFTGNCTVDFYFDGVKIGDSRLFSNSGYKTEKFYFPSGSRGYIFQWRQVDNDDDSQRGYVASVDLDIQLGDTEPSKVQAG